MNVVIDTNVWISALISKEGFGREIIRLSLQDKIFPQISTSVHKNLGKPRNVIASQNLQRDFSTIV